VVLATKFILTLPICELEVSSILVLIFLKLNFVSRLKSRNQSGLKKKYTAQAVQLIETALIVL